MKITERDITRTINQTIHAMAMDRQNEMVDGLRTLAGWWKSAGGKDLGQSYLDLCQHMEDEAVIEAGSELVRFRVRAAMQKAREERLLVAVLH